MPEVWVHLHRRRLDSRYRRPENPTFVPRRLGERASRVIAIGSTRKPTDRIRSFIKELTHVIPNAVRLTRGKQGFAEFCSEATSTGACRMLLVGAWHGNPGRLVFLQQDAKGEWVFQPPTILLKSVTLLRELGRDPPAPRTSLYVVPETPEDATPAESLAAALDATLTPRDRVPVTSDRDAVLHVGLHHRSLLEFLSSTETEALGPTLHVKQFLTEALGDAKRW
jgi:rRNA maturation protein Rpf1